MKLSIAVAAFLTLGSAVSYAADSATTDSAAAPAAGHGACAADIQKFCATVEHGKGKMHACLTEHASDLSDACKQRMAEHGSKSSTAPSAN